MFQDFYFYCLFRPLVAFTLGPCLIVAGYLLDRGALRFLLNGGREPPNPPAP
jgi:hypothetical protein